MTDEALLNTAIKAVESLAQQVGPDAKFPADLIWAHVPEHTTIHSLQRPGLVNALRTQGYIAKTGRTTRAVSGPRKGSPTTEYQIGATMLDELGIDVRKLRGAIEDTPAETPDSPVRADLPANSLNPAEPVQLLVHGCPGSGKSFALQQRSAGASLVVRTVFHPETRYADFVGTLRPTSVYRVDSDGEFIAEGGAYVLPGEPYVEYSFVPGPLVCAYATAALNPEASVVLIIEELSRANAALVFGDMLQLLDRIDDKNDTLPVGWSRYEIAPRPEIQAFLSKRGVPTAHASPGCMRFPPNLYLWATMNRADQNARQLDAAFLRRWRKQYMSFAIPCAYDRQIAYAGKLVQWDVFRGAINARLAELHVPEDKFIGPYFLTAAQLSDPKSMLDDLLAHLWHDVLKTMAPDFFDGALRTFSDLVLAWQRGDAVFGHIAGAT